MEILQTGHRADRRRNPGFIAPRCTLRQENPDMAQATHPAVPDSALRDRLHDPAYQAYQLLHVGFIVAPIVAGADKFFHLLVNWDQ
jgi:hypothetical protein